MRLFDTVEAVEATQQTSAVGGMGSILDIVLIAMLALVAGYGFYTVIRLKRECMLFPNKFLFPNGCTAETCLDEGEYIDFIIPRLLILSVACLIMAVAYGVRVYVFPEFYNIVVEIATIILPFSTLLWYAFVQKKAAGLYW